MVFQKTMGLCCSTRDTAVHGSVWHLHDEHRGQQMLEANPSAALARPPKPASLVCKRQTNLTGYSRPGARADKARLQALCTADASFVLPVQCIHLFLPQDSRAPVLFPSPILCSGFPTARQTGGCAPCLPACSPEASRDGVCCPEGSSPPSAEKRNSPKNATAETAQLVFEGLPTDQKIGLGRASGGNQPN